MANLTPKRKLPAGVKVLYELRNYTGGDGTQGNCREAPGDKGSNLAFKVFNTLKVYSVDFRLSNDLISPYYDPNQGWAMIETIDGTLFVESPSGENWADKRNHFFLVTDPTPNPNPPPAPGPVDYAALGKAFETLVKAIVQFVKG